MYSVHCGIVPPAAAKLLESEGRYFSKFTVLGFLPSTADSSAVPRHGSVHLGLGDFFFRGLLFWIRCVPFRQAHVWSDVITTHGRSCMQGSECLVPQVALMHTWVVEGQCRVNHLKMYYIYYYYYYYYYYL